MMGLNIKNEKTVSLVRDLAKRKGVSLVNAVTMAVEEKIAQVRAEAETVEHPEGTSRYERLMAFAGEYSRRVPNPTHSWDVDALFYDEDGLPR